MIHAGPPNDYWILGRFILTIILTTITLAIFFRTKEVYVLTKHKGLKYFRHSFLFFSIANFIQIILIFLKLTGKILNFREIILMHLPLLIFLVYMATLAILLLAYSTSYKKIEKKFPHFIFVIQIIAALVVVGSFAFKTPLLIFATHITAFLIAVITSHLKKSKKGFGKLSNVYTLMFLFWIVNILSIPLPHLIKPIINTPVQGLSIVIMVTIAYKVFKVTKS